MKKNTISLILFFILSLLFLSKVKSSNEENDEISLNDDTDDNEFQQTLKDIEDSDEFDDPDLLQNKHSRPNQKKTAKSIKTEFTPPPPDFIEIPRSVILMNYIYEITMGSFLIIFILNLILGKKKNKQIAEEWYDQNIKFFEENYAHLGAEKDYNSKAKSLLIPESYNQFKFFASGRVFLNWMLIKIELKKRQDLLTMLSSMFLFSEKDKIMYEASLSSSIPVVFSICKKKDKALLKRTYQEIETFTESSSPGYMSDNLILLAEDANFVQKIILDKNVNKYYQKIEPYIDMIFFTDRNGSGRNQNAIVFSFDVTNYKGKNGEIYKDMTIFVHILIDMICSSNVKGNYKKEADERRKEYDAKKSRELAEKNAEEVKNSKEEKKAAKANKPLTVKQAQKLEEKEKKEQLKSQRKKKSKVFKN